MLPARSPIITSAVSSSASGCRLSSAALFVLIRARRGGQQRVQLGALDPQLRAEWGRTQRPSHAPARGDGTGKGAPKQLTFIRSTGPGRLLTGQLVRHVGYACGQHPIHQFFEALAGGFGQQFEQGRAQGLGQGAAPDAARGRVGHLDDLARPPKHGNGHRALPGQRAEPQQLGFVLPVGLHLLAHVVGKRGNAHDSGLFAVDL